jgi:hypothetical protein
VSIPSVGSGCIVTSSYPPLYVAVTTGIVKVKDSGETDAVSTSSYVAVTDGIVRARDIGDADAVSV